MAYDISSTPNNKPYIEPWHGNISFHEMIASQPKPTVEQTLALGNIDYTPKRISE